MNKTFAIIITLLVCCSILFCSSINNIERESTKTDETTSLINIEFEQIAETVILTPDITINNPLTPDNTAPINGGTSYCSIHKPEYHAYPWDMMEYVGQEEFLKWVESDENNAKIEGNDCPFPKGNIYEFIRYFNYPKEVFIEQFNTKPWVSGDYNIDLLYSDDVDAVEAYYRNYDDTAKINAIKEENFITLKTDIILNNYDKLVDYTNWKIHSLIELMYVAGLDVSTVQQQAFKKNELMVSDSVYQSKYNYNFNIISGLTPHEIVKLIEKYTPFYLDCLICGQTPYDTPYEKQVAENKILFGK